MKTRAIMVVALAITVVSRPVCGQAHDPDPEAMNAFRDLVETYRRRPALTVTTTIEIEIAQGGVSSETREVKAEFVLGRGRAGVIRLRGFTCHLGARGTRSA